jgi:ferrous iron transport protein B
LGAVLSSAWTFPTALAFLTWYIFAPQCLSTLVVTRRETNSLLWPLVMFVYMFVLAYGAAFLVFQCAKFFGSL